LGSRLEDQHEQAQTCGHLLKRQKPRPKPQTGLNLISCLGAVVIRGLAAGVLNDAVNFSQVNLVYYLEKHEVSESCRYLENWKAACHFQGQDFSQNDACFHFHCYQRLIFELWVSHTLTFPIVASPAQDCDLWKFAGLHAEVQVLSETLPVRKFCQTAALPQHFSGQ
jgi:hypothetical protein